MTIVAGNVCQFVWYAPYGEALVDEHVAHYENPLKFSGKELDDITGLYDHGARSRNPISTLWYGIDPLFEKYPDFSPYNYCAGNPVKLVDLDGRDLNGGIEIINNSSETILLGGAGGTDNGGKSEKSYEDSKNKDNFLRLGPGEKLIPYKKGVVWKAKIFKENKEIADVYAYDVDYLQLQDGQTLTDSDGNCYSTDINDENSVTPVSSWTEKKEKHGDLKIRGAAIAKLGGSAGSIVFSDDNSSKHPIQNLPSPLTLSRTQKFRKYGKRKENVPDT